jgi:hypothetical protein
MAFVARGKRYHRPRPHRVALAVLQVTTGAQK